MRRPHTSLGLFIAAIGLALVTIPVPATQAATRPGCSSLTTAAHASTNPSTRASLITPWANEATSAEAKNGFTNNLGTPFKVSTTAAAGLVAVRRLYNPSNHDFRYVWDSSERSALVKKGYQDSAPTFYAANTSSRCVIPVYRYQKAGVTQYATTAPQRASLGSAGWTYDKVAFYAAPAAKASAATTAAATPLSQPLYVNKTSKAWYAYSKTGDTSTKKLLYQIAGTPTAIWLGGASTDAGFVSRTEAKAAAQKRTPEFVLYAIPNRDCGGYAAGGLNSVSAYEQWINSIRSAIAKRPTIVIVEPDAISMGCLSASGRANRIAMLSHAMRTLGQDPKTWAYIHAGSSLPTTTFAPVLKQVGVQYGRGIAVNVSSFNTTAKETNYANAMLTALSKIGVRGKHAVIDTSRNGLGPIASGTNTAGAPDWCNPPGRALGKRPTTKTGQSNVDAWLWIKPPGESDGQCHPGDPTGWFQSYALGLTQRALDNKIITAWALPG